jgi:hypothetical protein
VRLTVCSTLPIQQAIAYSINCSKAEKEIDLSQNGGKNKKGKNITTFRIFATFQTRLFSCGLVQVFLLRTLK